MDRKGFGKAVRKVILNNRLEVEERIDKVFQMLDERHDIYKSDDGSDEITAYSGLIEMIKEVNKIHEFDLQYLQLITLLAEKYVQLKDYRKLKNIALDTLDLLREESTPFESLEYTIPRIADSVEYSVYNHFLFEILLYFLREAYKSGKLDEELKFEAKKVLKLNILLHDNDFPYKIFDKEFIEALTNLFTPKELMDIILHPSLNSLKVDPVEYTWEWEHIFYKVEDQLDSILADVPRGMGFCYHYWSAKEELLKNEYNIIWHSPAVMNHGVMFD